SRLFRSRNLSRSLLAVMLSYATNMPLDGAGGKVAPPSGCSSAGDQPASPSTDLPDRHLKIGKVTDRIITVNQSDSRGSQGF
ncbi:MAG: hypothetical protein AAB263_17090, partial [Planctomycetota bacterium]